MAPDKAAFAALSKIYHFYPSFSGAIVALSKNGVHGRRSLMSAVIDCVAVILCACIREDHHCFNYDNIITYLRCDC